MNSSFHSANQCIEGVPVTNERIVVQKFGGTSVKEIEKLTHFVSGTIGKKVVVVSALAGVTNLLHQIIDHLRSGDQRAAQTVFEQVNLLHGRFLEEQGLNIDLSSLYSKLASLIHDFGRLDDREDKEAFYIQESIKGWGELASSQIVNAYFNQSGLQSSYADSSRLITLQPGDTKISIDRQETNTRVSECLNGLFEEGSNIVVMPGYIASRLNPDSEQDQIVTLDRGGSDYSAALIASAVNADLLQICKEVPGIMTANPKEVPEARVLNKLSLGAAAEGAAHGVNALHPRTISGLGRKNIPIQVLHTFDPSAQGTLISRDTVNPGVNLITSKSGFTVFHIHSDEMIGESGWLNAATRVFSDNNIDVETVSTSMSGMTFSVSANTNPNQLNMAAEQLKESFGEQAVRQISNISTVSLIGDELDANSNNIHIAARQAFTQINVLPQVSTQDLSGRNITYLFGPTVNPSDVVRALHKVFKLG